VPHVPADARSAQLIDVAVRVIARDGVVGATTRRIADEAGAPQAAVHYCFQSKENLLFAVFEHLSDRLAAETQREVTKREGLAKVAERLLTQTMEYAVEHLEQTRAEFAITLWAQTNSPELAVRMYNLFLAGWQDMLRSANGSTTSEGELESIVRMVAALIDGLSMQLLTDGDRDRARRDMATASAMLTAYVKTRTRHSAAAAAR
jgi:AcrR family transcriptional regulator